MSGISLKLILFSPRIIVCQVFCLALILVVGCGGPSVSAQDNRTNNQHSDELLQKLQQEDYRFQQHREPTTIASDASEPTELSQGAALPNASSPALLKPSLAIPDSTFAQYPESDYLLATGHGDLEHGALLCERVSDTVARMELAKQIRVLVKEHAIDRVREQTGKSYEQDIEIIREELTSELLRDVKIVNRTVDKASSTCSITAVMPKIRIAPKSGTNTEISPLGP